ncbi:MAG TPA: M14 family zinc carboxypeptidase [Vicinamibacterales bacterium]|nr:M14 family zinc carboxypeptidase [Vicinamibacterales bacterium]
MTFEHKVLLRWWGLTLGAAVVAAVVSIPAQQMVTDTRDAAQTQDEDFARSVKAWTTQPFYTSPLVDHLPRVPGIPMPKDVLGYHIGAPRTLTYYADIVKYYRALAAAAPNRVKIETIGKSDENRELIVVWISSDANIKGLQANRDNLAKIADPRGLAPEQVRALIATTRPHYHLMGGLHSGETGPSEMLMELAYRLVAETSPLITQIRDNVIVSVTPVADPDGRDRNVDWFYRNLETAATVASAPPATGTQAPAVGGPSTNDAPGGRGGPAVPYWGKYVYHDNNRDIHSSQVSMRALVDFYFTAHPPIMHDLHESLPLLYTYSGGPPQNPNLDPLLFTELPLFANFELAQMTKWGMPGVYTHAFMDGWSPGYLGSVAYNHNGMMRMYETQSGTDQGTAQGAGSAGAGRRTGVAPGADGAVPGAEAASGQGRGATAATAGPPAAAGPPTGRGGGQPREWYRGIPIPPLAAQNFSRRNNTNYMQTGVLSGLQLTSMIPNVVIENFYRKTVNSIEAGKTEAPYGYVIPPQRDMTRVATLVNLLRVQRIEVGLATGVIKLSDGTFPAGSYVIKRDQPYGRLVKNLLERQNYPDPNLRTYDDSGWTMGLASLVDVKEIKDNAVLQVATTPVKAAVAKGKVTGKGAAGMAVAHVGSNNMVAFRYRLKNVPMKIADKGFKAEGIEFPAGSFLIAPGADVSAVRAAVEELGLSAASMDAAPSVASHDADVPRVAMFTPWSGTQEIGWVRFTFDQFGIPYDLIYKERVKKGNLRADYDVVVMPAQNLGRAAVFQPPAARPVSYVTSEKYKFLGMYGSSDDITGGFGAEGGDAFHQFLNAGGTLITMGNAVRFPTESGMARSVDASGSTTSAFYAPRPIVNAEVLRLNHPVFYGYTDRIMPIKYLAGPLMTVGDADRGNVLARYVGGDAAVLSGLMRGAEELRDRPFAVDVPGGATGKGRVIMFANNPIYRWQNHGEFNMVFNSILNWNDLGSKF